MCLCSVIIPSYNRVELSIRAIKSVLSQNFIDFELLFIDDGSTDDYTEIKKLLNRDCAKYLRKSNGGVSSARNLGIKESSGELIFFLDSDDEWLKDKLSVQVEYFKKNEKTKIVHSNENWFRFNRPVQVPKHLTPAFGDAFERSIKTCCVNLSSVGIRRELINEIGLFDEEMRICEDYDYWLRILLHYPIALLDNVLANKYSGTHPQLSQSESAMDRYRLYSLLKIYLLAETSENTRYKIELVRCEILKKARMLLNGAKKRNLPMDCKVYNEILGSCQQNRGFISNQILTEFLPLLAFRRKFQSSDILDNFS